MRASLAATSIGVAMLAGACNPESAESTSRAPRNPTPEQIARMSDPNVVGVYPLFDSFDPWIWNDSHERPRGVHVKALYLIGRNSKGVFGEGVIRPKLFVRQVTDSGEVSWRLEKEWSLNMQEAIPFRSKRQTAMGWGYSLYLPWDELPRLAGRQVRLIVEFERTDGRRVISNKKDFRVPTPSSA